MPTSEAALHSTWRGVYAVLAGYDVQQGSATLLIFVNPFVNLVWAGGVLYALCAIPFLLPAPKKVAARAPVPEPAATQPA